MGEGPTAREMLVRYLRQRAELGERELYLERTARERMLGALGSGAWLVRETATAPRADAAPPGVGPAPPQMGAATPEVSAPPSTDEMPAGAEDDEFGSFRAEVLACTRCRLAAGRRTVVFGEGDRDADLMVVGEAPGHEEDRSGRPFVGAAGQLLDRMLKAIDFDRGEVFICNVLKCRPPKNRDPLPDEVAACRPYLLRQIELIRPKAIGALGRFASQALLGSDDSLRRMRGVTHDLMGVPLVVTYHPAALLRNSQWKRDAWEDLQLLRRVYDEAGGRPPARARG